MAPTASKSTGTKLQTWLPITLAEQLKAESERQSRSVSNLIKVAVEDHLRGDQGRKP
jgi:CopG-like RHH_1 or ribbon-helix-helix domain, RHH_5